MKWLRDHALNIYAGLAVAYMLIPIGVIAVFSFNNPAGRYNFTWEGFTLDHWKDPFAIEELTDAMITSIELAAVATVISTALGVLVAMALVRYEFFGRKTSNLLIVIPTATPEVVIGAALLSMFLLPPFVNFINLGFQSLVIAHVMFSISFVVIVVRSRLIGFDRSLEEASRDLGASAFTTFRTITLPLSLPGVFAAGLFGLVGCLGESAVPIILGGVGYELIGNTITSSMDVLNYPLAAALSSIVILLMLLLMLGWYLVFDMRSFLGRILEWRA